MYNTNKKPRTRIQLNWWHPNTYATSWSIKCHRLIFAHLVDLIIQKSSYKNINN